MSAITLRTDQVEWTAAGAYPEGTTVKVLRDEGNARTVLLKLPPGFRMDAHDHTCDEQHFVLEGAYERDGEEYSAPTYAYIPARSKHGPFTSREGAVVLVIWGG